MPETATCPMIAVGTCFLPVTDQDRALAFYRDVLGFEVRADDMFGEGMRWVSVAPPGAYTVVALTPPSMQGEGQAAGSAAMFGFDTANLESAMAELGAKGVTFDVMQAHPPVPPMAKFTDPDGNSILIVERDGER